MLIYMFPGQGSQRQGMGRELLQKYSSLIERANDILGYSVEEMVVFNPENKLDNTLYTQPIIYIINTLYYMDMKNKRPDYVIGHSLGEYNALFVAGAFSFEDGLRLVKKRAELMSESPKGGMVAVLGINLEKIQTIIKKYMLKVEIANINAPNQIVIAGKKDLLQDYQEIFLSEGAADYILLNVSGAFHTSMMNQAAYQFGKFIEPFNFHEIKIPVISNVTGKEIKNSEIKQLLTFQINHTVQWEDSIRYIIKKGDCVFQQIGMGRTLKNMVRKISSS